ncbi:MAG: PaaX family transcriptional regulator C-terminal domain-containing protein [Acidimicrobiales bacterium]
MAETTVSIPTRLLVLGMAHEDGIIATGEVNAVAEACGQSAEQVRSCLRRLVAEDLFVREGTGRSSSYRPTPAGLTALSTTIGRTRLAYAQDAAGRGWDRQWRLVAFAVAERERAARDAFRDRLISLGGAAVQGGLYASPHPWHDDVLDTARELGIDANVTVATTDDLVVAGERDPRQLASTLWAVDDLGRRYDDFLTQFSPVLDALSRMRQRKERLPDAAFLPGALAMAVAFNACFDSDPLLPPELLPRPWPGRAARELLVSSRRLALQLRKEHGRPALFRATYDEAIETIS